MMNIVVFETETWAQTAWQRMKDDHEVKLLEEYLTTSKRLYHAALCFFYPGSSSADLGCNDGEYRSICERGTTECSCASVERIHPFF
jgi:hypothetical protein